MINTTQPQPAPCTLLIIDDDQAFGRILSWEFEDLGYAVWTAADCAEATACARTLRFDSALIDVHLPDGNGISLAGELLKIQPQLQFVLMSADMAGASELGAMLPATPVVAKPLRPLRMHHFLRARLSRQRAGQAD